MDCIICHLRPEDNNRGTIKFCLQYFPSVRQLRVSIFSVKDLSLDNRRLGAKVSLLDGNRKVKSACCTKKAYTYLNKAVFNENIYLILTRAVGEYCLRIRLDDVPTERCYKCFRKSSVILEATIAFQGLEFNLDTTVEMKLANPKYHQDASEGDVKISRAETLHEQVQKLRRRFGPTMNVRDVNRYIYYMYPYGSQHRRIVERQTTCTERRE